MATKTTAVQNSIVTVRKIGGGQPVKRKLEKCSTEVIRETARKIVLEHRKVFEELAK